ncbi:ribonuclease H2 non-catalytic subunit-domain-containing protein [Mycena sp. CBHHK59/15]|nr:ribonuclease H2 non-catalytic subunit-domain-containing protein [Mycena sp. CBHHK59/15]
MAAPTLTIAPIADLASLPIASPNLMPFHIEHTGPAPVSTYFLVEAAIEHVAKPPPSPSAAPDADSGMSMGAEDAEDPAGEGPPATEPTPPAPTPPSDRALLKRVTETTTRFVATFRGRIMQGLKVELPPDYSGFILTRESTAAEDKANGLKAKPKRATKPKSRGNTGGRATRSTGARFDADKDDGCGDGEDGFNDNQSIARTLMPTARFSSFVLWHPDIPVDAGKDEYMRSLTEWIRLADEVCLLAFPKRSCAEFTAFSPRYIALRSRSHHTSSWEQSSSELIYTFVLILTAGATP